MRIRYKVRNNVSAYTDFFYISHLKKNISRVNKPKQIRISKLAVEQTEMVFCFVFHVLQIIVKTLGSLLSDILIS